MADKMDDPPPVHLDLAMADAQLKLETLQRGMRDYVTLLESLCSGSLQPDPETREKIRAEMLRLKGSIEGVTAEHRALIGRLRNAPVSTTKQ